jgi:phage portal protein BeeE
VASEEVARRERSLLSFPNWGRKRSDPAISIDQWASFFSYMNTGYQLNPSAQFSLGGKEEEPWPSYEGFALSMFKGNPVVFACMSVRSLLFSEARFTFRSLSGGRPGKLFGNPELGILEKPWTNGTTGDLLMKMISDVDLAGNFYAVRIGKKLYRLRPDWMTIVMGSKMMPEEPGFAMDCEVIGYSYQPGGPARRRDPIPLLPEFVAHWAPMPDPLARYRGMSWLTPVVREVMADSAASTHKLKFFENGATPNLSIVLPESIQLESFNKWVEAYEKKFGEADGAAALNAYKTLFLGAGADVQVIGANMRQIAFKDTQGAGETRIAAAGGVPPVIVGLSEGLQAATYSNYQLAMRRFTDLTMRPLWRSAAASVSPLVTVPSNAMLWYDDRDIPALANDEKDNAEIQQMKAATIKTLVDAGFKADDVIAAVQADDFTTLEHSGLFSVQLQPASDVPQGKGALTTGKVVKETGAPMNGAPTTGQAAAILAGYLASELE